MTNLLYIKFGYTVLHVAVSDGNIDIVKILLSDERCDVNAKDIVSDNIIYHVTNLVYIV